MKIADIIQKIDNNLIPFFQYCYYGRNKQYKNIIYNFFINRQIKQIRPILKIIYLYIFFPIYFIIGFFLYLAKIRFFLVDLSQIGSIVWLEMFLREIGKDRKYKIIICKQKKYQFANNELINLYKENFIFIESFILRLCILPFMHINYLTINTSRFEIDNRCSYAHKVFKNHSNSNIKKDFKTNFDVNKILNKITTKYKIDLKNYVTIHVRDSGFYNDKSRQTRNADLNTYLPLILRLQELGYVVVKLGDKNSKQINHQETINKKMYFDYAVSSLKSELNDIVLVSNAKFHIGTPSGLSFIPMIFNVNTYWTNMNTLSQSLGFLDDDLTVFKKIVDVKNEKFLPLSNYFEYPFDQNLQYNDFKKLGYKMLNNTDQEILECFEEFYDNLKNKKTQKFNIKKYMKLNNYSYNAAGSISNKFIEKFYKYNV